MSFTEFLRIAGSLSKIRISLPVTATTFTGFIVYSGSLSSSLIPLLSGVFLLASGSSALNQYQERKTDSMMERTRKRPLPNKMVSPRFVVFFSILLLFAGSIILFLNFHLPVVVLGLLTAFWYNCVYTTLKKHTAFAVIPGSVTGGIPPVIGWIAAGGGWIDQRILLIVLFFVIGQIPHFWLLLLKYGKQYEDAGLPSLTTIFTKRQIKRISNVWIIATLASSSLLPIYGLLKNPLTITAYLIVTFLLFLLTIFCSFSGLKKSRHNIQFYALNIFYLIIMVLLVADNLQI